MECVRVIRVEGEAKIRVPIKGICTVILAGGQSSRMGTPKELLSWGSTTLVEHLSREVMATGLPCLVVSNAPESLPASVKNSGAQVTSDLVPSYGPVSGIVTGFRARAEEVLLVLSCDLPFMDRVQIDKLIHFAKSLSEEWDAVIAKERGRVHPLCALYRRKTQPLWEEALQDGRLRLMSTLEKMRVNETPEGLLDEWAAFNANTPEEYAEAVREAKRRKTGQS